MTVLGVDACTGSWLAIAIDERGFVGGFVERTMERVAARAASTWGVGVIVVDIPIGLPDRTPRAANTLARAAVQPRGSSVFPTPVRPALEAPDYARAAAAAIAATGVGLSRQAYAIREGVLDVDGYLRGANARVADAPAPDAPAPDVREGHPEVSFAAMLAAVADGTAASGTVTSGTATPRGGLPEPKKTAAGSARRAELLAAHGIVIPTSAYADFGHAALDDVYDAAAMAWTALRVSRGEASSLPDPPEVFADGLPSAIWF